MKEKIGVFLSRMQPLHIGHLGIIEKALEENDKVVVLIGSKNKEETIRNPIKYELRKEILEEALEENFSKNYKERIIVSALPDWSMETDIDSNIEWGNYLYYNIVSLAEQKTMTFYFSDSKDVIDKWFEPVIRRRINFRLFERDKMFNAISSTKIREAFFKGDKEYIEKSCPKAVVKRYDEIRNIIKIVNENPKQDFVMEE